MSKGILKILIIICAAVLAAAVILGLTGVFRAVGYHYENEDRYTAGNAEITGEVRNLDIHWINGRVDVAYHTESTVTLSETSDRAIAEDLRLRWWLDGDTLRVQYAAPRDGFSISWTQQKELTLTLPEEIALNDVTIEATSADVDVPALRADTAALSTTSGDISLTVGGSSRSIRAGSTSGSIGIRADMAEALSATSTSGGIGIAADQISTLSANSTSGGIAIAAERVDELRAGSTSGGVGIEITDLGTGSVSSTSGGIAVAARAFRSLEISATSGGITAHLPETPGFTARVSTTSGEFTYGLPLQHEDSSWVCGDGSASLRISATSGNVRLDPVE